MLEDIISFSKDQACSPEGYFSPLILRPFAQFLPILHMVQRVRTVAKFWPLMILRVGTGPKDVFVPTLYSMICD